MGKIKELRAPRDRTAIEDLTNRLSPEVVEIVRLDLIQKVGNALRFARSLEQDKLDIEEVVEHQTNQNWGAW